MLLSTKSKDLSENSTIRILEPPSNKIQLAYFYLPELQTTTLIFILKVLRCSNNLMQKMTSITPSMKLSMRKYFSNLTRNFDNYRGFRQSFIMVGPFTAIPSIGNQWSLIRATPISNLRTMPILNLRALFDQKGDPTKKLFFHKI